MIQIYLNLSKFAGTFLRNRAVNWPQESTLIRVDSFDAVQTAKTLQSRTSKCIEHVKLQLQRHFQKKSLEQPFAGSRESPAESAFIGQHLGNFIFRNLTIWCRICWVLNYKFVSKQWPPRRDASVRPSRCWQANVNSAVAYWNIFLWRGRVLYDSNVTMNMSVEIGKTLPGRNVNWTIKLKEVIKSVEKPNRSYCFKSDASNKRLSFFYFVRFALWIMNLESIFRLQKTRLSKEPA